MSLRLDRIIRHYPINLVITFLFHFGILLLFIPALTLASGIDKNSNSEDSKYNVIMIVVNALRVDHLGCYGYPRNTSPNIDMLAQDGIFFDRAISQSYWTLPSLVSIFTSKFVCAHGINSRDMKLGKGERTLAEILKIYGYNTAAFTCGLDTVAVYGLDRGFDIYDVYSGDDAMGSFSDIMPGAIKWLKKNRNKKFFLFLQSYDVHPSYKHSDENSFGGDYKGVINNLPLDYGTLKKINNRVLYRQDSQIRLGTEDINYIIARYDDGIRRADEFIGHLMGELKRLKLYDKTIIVLCADHGEELGERGTFNRFGNQNLYQEVIRAPLIIRYPPLQLTGQRIHSLVGLVDIMPTILDLLGIPKGYDFQGESLASIIRTGTAVTVHKYVFSEGSRYKWAILGDDGWKLLYSPEKSELYNINNDPLERDNLIGQKLDVQVSLMKKFFLWRESHKRENEEDNRIELDSQLIEGLRKAGYW